MITEQEALDAHKKARGKYEIIGKVPIITMADLSTYYTPGVAYVCEAIKREKEKAYEYTSKGNTVAIINDGTRVLGLGDIGPEAGLPVMEGKAILFKKFGGVDAIPLSIATKDEDEIVKFVTQVAPTFGAINIEDISSPKCFNIVERLSATLDIPVFHDDNHGSGVVAHAALINALKLAGKNKTAKVVVNGAGAAGMGVIRQLVNSGFKNIIVVDTKGAIYSGREQDMNKYKQEIASNTNREKRQGRLEDVVKGADVLIGFSVKGAFTSAMIRSMNEKAIVFALANPEPEIPYDEAKKAGAFIVATGRSDTANQVNNLLAFPGIMRGLLDARAKRIDSRLLDAAANSIAKSVGKRLTTEFIIPSFADPKDAVKVATNVAEAVAMEAVEIGIARIQLKKGETKARTNMLLKRYSKIEKRVLGL